MSEIAGIVLLFLGISISILVEVLFEVADKKRCRKAERDLKEFSKRQYLKKKFEAEYALQKEFDNKVDAWLKEVRKDYVEKN